MNILVTGGLGYIGSHTVVELLNDDNNKVIIVDNLANSSLDVMNKIKKITNKNVKLYIVDLINKDNLEKVFNDNNIDVVIHFAGLKAVGESIIKPLDYYTNNIISTLNLLNIMKKFNVKNLIFSSSATVYGEQTAPYVETMKRGITTNPYGTTKSMIENILEDFYNSNKEWNITILRYFNPVGAHESGLIGEKPNGVPNNLMPYIMQVASGKLECLNVFGDDYNTKDGTGVRDFIHVVDLAKGHVKAIENPNNGFKIYNLGTGKGYTVLEIINMFEKVNNVKINFKIVGRREGDIGICYSDPSKAKHELNWKAEKSLEDMCRDSWNFEKNCKII